MRQILVDRARQKLSLKGGGGMNRVDIEEMELPDKVNDDRVLLVDECLKRLEKNDPERARVVTLKFFGGLSNKDVAEVLGIGERSVDRQWAYAKTVLFEMIQAEK
jgi:RNA polymerase sigma factor (TIGR02999 family)